MKGITDTKRVGGRGIEVRPTRTSNMQSHKGRVVMHHTVKQSTGISLKSTQTMIVKMNSDTDIMLKDDQENI